VTVSDGRVPALTAFWESVSLPGIYFAGNASQGARGLTKRGAGASSTAVNGFRYNARVMAEYIARTIGGRTSERPAIADVVPFLLRELSTAPELWVQKGYLCRVVGRNGSGFIDEGLLPLAHFLDSHDGDAAAATVEVDERGAIVPTIYVRRAGEVSEHLLDSHPLHEYTGEAYAKHLEHVLRPLAA
jgi:hypothetical protein